VPILITSKGYSSVDTKTPASTPKMAGLEYFSEWFV